MITKGPSVPSFFTSKGISYPTLELAQHAELFELLDGDPPTPESTATICTRIYENRDAILVILRATGRKARKAKASGATRKRKASGAGVSTDSQTVNVKRKASAEKGVQA